MVSVSAPLHRKDQRPRKEKPILEWCKACGIAVLLGLRRSEDVVVHEELKNNSLASSRSWPPLLPVLSQGLGGGRRRATNHYLESNDRRLPPLDLDVPLLPAVSSRHGGASKRITSTYQRLLETVILPRWSVPNKRSVSQ